MAPVRAVLAWCLFAVVATPAGAADVPCIPNGGTYEVTAFDNLATDLKTGACQKIGGNLLILCAQAGNDASRIKNLDFLSEVHTITGYLKIQGCGHLTNIDGLSKLKKIGGTPTIALEISGNTNLTDIKGLENLEEITLGKPAVRIRRNENLCYADLMDWSRVVKNAADSYDQRKIDIFIESASCLARTCDGSCHCGYCGGAGACAQSTCASHWYDLPDWVESDEEKTGYALIIVFSLLGSIFVVLTIVGCVLGKVRMQILVSFQKPPKKIQPKFRAMPFNEGPWNQGVNRFAHSIDDMLEDGSENHMGEPVNFAGAQRPLTGKESMTGQSIITLPGIKQDEDDADSSVPQYPGGTEGGTGGGGGGGDDDDDKSTHAFPDAGDAAAAKPAAAAVEDRPKRKGSLVSLMGGVSGAKQSFMTPGQNTIVDETPDDKFDDMECICGKPAEFECSRCASQGYCSSNCQRVDWKSHRDACKRIAREKKGGRTSRRSSIDTAARSARHSERRTKVDTAIAGGDKPKSARASSRPVSVGKIAEHAPETPAKQEGARSPQIIVDGTQSERSNSATSVQPAAATTAAEPVASGGDGATAPAAQAGAEADKLDGAGAGAADGDAGAEGSRPPTSGSRPVEPIKEVEEAAEAASKEAASKEAAPDAEAAEPAKAE